MRYRAVKEPEMRLRDLNHWHLVYGACGACGRRRRISNDTLRRGPHGERDGSTKLNDLTPYLRCDGCENTRGNFFVAELKPR